MRALDYQTAFHLAPVGLVLSRERVIEDCNEQLCAIFGYAREALIGQSFQVLYPSPDEFERIGARIAAHHEHLRHATRDDRIMKRANGELFWCHVTGRALIRADAHAAGVWTFEDLSATRRVAVELTPREREIAAQLVTGKTSKQIGRVLEISPRTVDIYRARLMRKYDTRQCRPSCCSACWAVTRHAARHRAVLRGARRRLRPSSRRPGRSWSGQRHRLARRVSRSTRSWPRRARTRHAGLHPRDQSSKRSRNCCGRACRRTCGRSRRPGY